MNAWMRNEVRDTVSRQRRRPGQGGVLHLSPSMDGQLGPPEAEPPSELRLEVTDPGGELAPWCEDGFWLEAIERWAAVPLSVHILPTPQALLNNVVLHSVRMLRRVVPQWRLIGHCYVGDLAGDTPLGAAASSPYHELHVLDGPRPGSEPQPHAFRLEDAFARIRQAQNASGVSTPLLVRCPGDGVPDVEPANPRERSRTGGAVTPVRVRKA